MGWARVLAACAHELVSSRCRLAGAGCLALWLGDAARSHSLFLFPLMLCVDEVRAGFLAYSNGACVCVSAQSLWGD